MTKLILVTILVLCSSLSYTDAFIGRVANSGRRAAERAVNVTQKAFDTVVGTPARVITTTREKIVSEVQSAMNQLNRIDACTAVNGSVSCCANTFFNRPLCLNSAMSAQLFNISVTYNNRTLVSREVKGVNMPPICAPLPPMPAVQFCLRAYELLVHSDGYQACFSVSARLSVKDIAAFDLNCIRVRSSGDISMVAPSSTSKTGLLNANLGAINPFLDQEFNGFNITRKVLQG